MKPIQQFFARGEGRSEHHLASFDGKSKEEQRSAALSGQKGKPTLPSKDGSKSKINSVEYLLAKKSMLSTVDNNAPLSPIEERLQTVKTKTTAQQHIYTDSKERAAQAVVSSPVTVQQQQQQQQPHPPQSSPQQGKDTKAGWRSRSLPNRASARLYTGNGDILSFNWSPQLMGSAAAGQSKGSQGPAAPDSHINRTPSSGSVTHNTPNREPSKSLHYPSSPNIPKQIRTKSARVPAANPQPCPKRIEPYYAILEPESGGVPSKVSPSRGTAVQVTYPTARRAASLSSGKAGDVLGPPARQTLSVPAKSADSAQKQYYSVVLKKAGQRDMAKRRRDDHDDEREPTPPPLTKRIASDGHLHSTAASTPHEEGSSSVVIKAPEDNSAVFNPIQPPQEDEQDLRDADTSPSQRLETSSTSAFEPISKMGRILRTTSLPAGPRPSVHTRHVHCPIADYHPSKEMVSTLLQKIAGLEAQHDKTIEVMAAERSALQVALDAEAQLLRRVCQQYVRNERQHKAQRRRMESQIRALQGQVVTIARHTAYFASRLEEHDPDTVESAPFAQRSTFQSRTPFPMGDTGPGAVFDTETDNLCNAVSLPSLCSQTPSPRPPRDGVHAPMQTSPMAQPDEAHHGYRNENCEAVAEEEEETREAEGEADSPPGRDREADGLRECIAMDGSYDMSEEIKDIRHVFSHLEKFDLQESRRNSLIPTDSLMPQDADHYFQHRDPQTRANARSAHLVDEAYQERRQAVYNERNIDLAIRFSEQAETLRADDYPLSRTGTDDSFGEHDADFQDKGVPDGMSESSVSSGTWPSPNHIVKVKKFFGQEPPHLLRNLLKSIRCEHLAKKFEKRSIGLLEFPMLTEKQLKNMKVGKDARQRILQQIHQMQAKISTH